MKPLKIDYCTFALLYIYYTPPQSQGASTEVVPLYRGRIPPQRYSPSTEVPLYRVTTLQRSGAIDPPIRVPPPTECPPLQRGHPPTGGGAPSAGWGGLNFIKIRKIWVTALRPEKKPLVGANFQKIF